MGLRPGVTAVLIVRVWLEEHEVSPLRAVMTRFSDVLTDEPPAPVNASSPEEIMAAVQSWLDGLLEDPASG